MRFKGFRGPAAVLGLDNGGNKLQKALLEQKLPDSGDHLGDFDETPVGFRAEGSVEVTFAEDEFTIFQACPLVRERTDGFGKEAEAFDEDGDFAALGFDDFAGGFDEVAEVEEVEFGVAQVSGGSVSGLNELASKEELDFAGLVLEMAEGEGALLSPGDESAGNGDLLIFVFGEVFENRFGEMGAFALGRIRIEV